MELASFRSPSPPLPPLTWPPLLDNPNSLRLPVHTGLRQAYHLHPALQVLCRVRKTLPALPEHLIGEQSPLAHLQRLEVGVAQHGLATARLHQTLQLGRLRLLGRGQPLQGAHPLLVLPLLRLQQLLDPVALRLRFPGPVQRCAVPFK